MSVSEADRRQRIVAVVLGVTLGPVVVWAVVDNFTSDEPEPASIESEEEPDTPRTPTDSACQEVAYLAGDILDDRIIDPDEFHDSLVDVRDTARAGPDDDVAEALDGAVSAAASGVISTRVLDDTAAACADGGWLD